MRPIEERRHDHELAAFVAHDTIDVLIERVTNLVTSGRRMTLIRRWIHHPHTFPEVQAGLELGDRPENAVTVTTQHTPDGTRFVVYLTKGHAFGFSAYRDDGDARTVAGRYHAPEPRDTTRIEITGGVSGPSSSDQIRILRYNRDGAGEQIIVAFDYADASAETEVTARVLDQLAAQARTAQVSYDADALTAVAAQLRTTWEPLEQVLTTSR